MLKEDKVIAWIAFACVGFFWGTTYLAIRIGVQSFPPFLMAGTRHTIGGLLICSYFLLKGYPLPDFKTLRTFAINGFLMLAVANGLVTWAEISVSSGLAALVCSITPIWIVLINSTTIGREKIGIGVIMGFILCLAGQYIIFADNIKDFSNPRYTMGILALVIANIAWALGTIYSKNHRTNVNSLFGAGLQMLPAGILLDIYGVSLGELNNINPSADAIWAIIYLIIFGSIISYSAYLYLLKKLPTTIVSTTTYVNTVVAVGLGWLVLDEKLNMHTAAAVLITIAGLYFVNNSFKRV